MLLEKVGAPLGRFGLSLSAKCDVCHSRLGSGEKPLCVSTCDDGSIDYREADPVQETDLVEVLDGVVVKVAGGVLWEPFFKESEKA